MVKMATSSMEYPSSALRYGLLSIKPIPYEEIVKVKGIKFKTTGIRFEPEKQFDKYEDFIDFRYYQIFERMPLPEAFSLEKTRQHFVETAIKTFNEDKELQNELEKKETSLLGFVSFLRNRFESRVSEYYEIEANRFLHSNLPLSFFSQIAMVLNTYQKYLSLIKRVVRRCEMLSGLPGIRNRFGATERQLKEMKQVLSPLIDKMDSCLRELHALKLYVILWSAKDIDEVDHPEFLDITKLDQAYFLEYFNSYTTQLRNMRRMIYDVSKDFDPEIFSREIASSNTTTVLLSKLLSSDIE